MSVQLYMCCIVSLNLLSSLSLSQSFLDFTETDVESWMKAANIDVYWECFKNGGITTGRRLQELDENSLRVSELCNAL